MTCPACATDNPDGANFCLNCGTPLREAGPRREERRTVTVVFADMVGFTDLGERLDQESLRRVMDRFYAEMRGAIEEQRGSVAKFIGDAVMAVWGTPVVREDDAIRAVRAAEAMRRALGALNDDLERRWGVRVGMRTGVNTGEVVVDTQRPADLLVGDTLNVAARLEQAAADGEVLVGPDTYRLVRGEARLEPRPPLNLKGKARALSAWRLIDGSRPERRAEPRMTAPLVGREGELDRLRDAFEAAVGASECRLATIVGSPGVGKSRLAAELADVLGTSARVIAARCEPAAESTSLGPATQILRAGAGLLEEDAPGEVRAKLRAVVADDVIAEQLAGVLGLAPIGTNEEVFWAARRFLEVLAAERPLLLVVDDLHWAQPTFLDFVEHLADWSREAPILVLAVARPELRELRPALAERGALDLRPLRPASGRELLDRLLGSSDLPPQLAERVLETTEGNPLFLGEMLRMLVDDGVLRREDGHWTATGESAPVPPTINALLAARLERLDAAERAVIESAAVIGPRFPAAAVADLTGAEVDEPLLSLQRKELVAPTDASEESFRFQHVLMRDAAYRSLLKEARADLHERYARWLETTGGDQDELVGFNLERAWAYRDQLGPLDDIGLAIGEHAAARLHAAGARALARDDLPAAERLLRRALGPLDGADPRRLVILDALAETLLSEGETIEGEWVVEELALRSDRPLNERFVLHARVHGGQLANLTGGSVTETLEVVSAAATRLAELGDAAATAKAHQVCAGAHSLAGQVAAAEAALDDALVAARDAGDARRVTAVLAGSPPAALWGPSPVMRASGRCLDVVRILRMTPGHRDVEAIALRCQAVLEAMRGRAEAARAILAGCRETLEELGASLELEETSFFDGIVELLAGDPTAAEARLRAACDGYLRFGMESGAARASAMLARALLEQGRDEEALEAARFAEERGGEDLKTTIARLGVRAEALARSGELWEALALAQRAVSLAEPTDALADKADAAMALAAVLRIARRPDDAHAAALSARELYAAKGHAVGVRRAEREAGGAPATAVETTPPAVHHDVPETSATRAWRRWPELMAEPADWDGLAELYAPEYAYDDFRPTTRHTLAGNEAMVAMWRRTLGAMRGLDIELEILAVRGDRLAAGHIVMHGLSQEGGPYELDFAGTVEVDAGGRLLRNELYADAETALARLDERAAEGRSVTVLADAAGHEVRALDGRVAVDGQQESVAGGGAAVLRRFDECCAELWHGVTVSPDAPERIVPAAVSARAAWAASFAARDWDAVLAPAFEDRLDPDPWRVGWGARDRATLRAEVETLVRVAPDLALSDELVLSAGRGDRHASAGVVTFCAAAFEERVGLVVTGRGDRVERLVFVEPNLAALREAFAEIAEVADEETRVSPTAPEPVPEEIVGLMRAWVDALNERDFPAVAATYAPDVVIVDRRTMGWDEIRGADAAVEVARQIVAIAPDVRVHNEALAGWVDGDRAIWAGQCTFGGHEAEHNTRFEVRFGTVGVTLGGRTTLSEMLPDDDEAVLARFAELVAEASGGAAGNAATRWYSRRDAALRERDWDALRALIDTAAETVDHRHGRQQTHTGNEAPVEVLKSIADGAADASWRYSVIAVRGEDLVLMDVVVSGHGLGDLAFEAALLHLVRVGGEGLLVRAEIFDAADRELALARLDELAATPAS